MSNELWQNNPTGLIPKGTVCPTCARYNARNITCNVIVWKDQKVLLIQRDHEPGKGLWAIPGGYVGWDETVEESARRELQEETGLVAGKLQFVGTRSDSTAGDERQNIDLYFYTSEVSGEPKQQVGEVKNMDWFSLEELPQPMAFDHGRLLKLFVNNIKTNSELPVPLIM